MRLLAPLVLCAALGCDTTVTTPDFGTVETGICRPPSACYVATACACTGGSVADCLQCDPTGNAAGCDCSQFTGSACVEAAQVCVGRGPVCDGRCVRPTDMGDRCADPGGVPPQVVVVASSDVDAGVTQQRRCPFVDDVCCPTASTPRDAGASVD
jgi:hypothetical protein